MSEIKKKVKQTSHPHVPYIGLDFFIIGLRFYARDSSVCKRQL